MKTIALSVAVSLATIFVLKLLRNAGKQVDKSRGATEKAGNKVTCRSAGKSAANIGGFPWRSKTWTMLS